MLHWAAEPLLSLICYYPDSAVGKGSVPDLGFRLVSSAPAAVGTIVVDVGGGQSAPQGPESRGTSRRRFLLAGLKVALNSEPS